MENQNDSNQGTNKTNRPSGCVPFTIEFTTNSDAHKMGDRQYVEETDIKIGRSSECTIRFGDDCKSVSRLHAQIECTNGQYILKHLSESNPTFVNGKKVITQYTLSHRDTIQLSDDGPKLLFIAPGAMGSNMNDASGGAGGQSTARSGGASTARTDSTLRPSGGEGTAMVSGGCLPFTIEFGKRSQMNYEGQRKTISEVEVLIGRAPNSIIRFGQDCNEISSEHAIIRCKAGKWYIEHKSKTNKTFVNNQEFTGERALTHADVIHFSSTSGQFIRFYISGAETGTGRVVGTGTPNSGGTLTPALPSYSTRIKEMAGHLTKTQRITSYILGGGLMLALALFGLSEWDKRNKHAELEQKVATEAANVKIIEETRTKNETINELKNSFPESQFEKFIFFASGEVRLELKFKGKQADPIPFQGSAFLDNHGNLITARHVIQLFDYPSCFEAKLFQMLNDNGITTEFKFTFNSPKAQEMVIEPIFQTAKTKPSYTVLDCSIGKTCSASEDWAVTKPPGLAKLAKESPIIVDREYAKLLKTTTPLYILGFDDNKGTRPQLKAATLDVIDPIQNDRQAKLIDPTRVKFFKCRRPNYGDGDSGAPVFAFRENDAKWVVVGMVIMMESYWDNESKYGLILPINLIPANYFD